MSPKGRALIDLLCLLKRILKIQRFPQSPNLIKNVIDMILIFVFKVRFNSIDIRFKMAQNT